MDYADEVIDEQLVEDFLASEEYDRWRDDQCDALFEALGKLYIDFVKPTSHGYFKDSPEKFLEHTIELLQDFTKCDVTAINGNITAVKHEPKTVEFVEG